jgi:transposase-like protein
MKMTTKRRQHSAEFKFRVALAAVREVNTVSELASQHDVHPTLIRKWKQQLLQEGPQVFARFNGQAQQEQAVQENELYEQIGRLKMELEWLKKKAAQFE